MYVDVKLKKIGGSLHATIPKEVVREEKLHENEVVRMNIEKKTSYKTLKDFFGTLPRTAKSTQQMKDELRAEEFEGEERS